MNAHQSTEYTDFTMNVNKFEFKNCFVFFNVI